MPPEPNWWEHQEPIHDFGSDGQTWRQVFARKVKGRWEYAIVTFPDGDGAAFATSVILLQGGSALEALEE